MRNIGVLIVVMAVLLAAAVLAFSVLKIGYRLMPSTSPPPMLTL